MPSYTTAQAEAIACLDEPIQIIACAGSGKTEVVAQRVVKVRIRALAKEIADDVQVRRERRKRDDPAKAAGLVRPSAMGEDPAEGKMGFGVHLAW